MSFSKTVSTVAALTTIFGASVAAWKVVEYNESQKDPQVKQLEQRLLELQKQNQENKKKYEELMNAIEAQKSVAPSVPVLPETNETTTR